MNNKNTLQTLFNYTWHTTNHLLAVAAQLSEADYKTPTAYKSESIHDVSFHLLQVAMAWLNGVKTGKQSVVITKEQVSDLAPLRAKFADVQADWTTFLDSLSDEQIAGDIHLINWRGEPVTFVYWRVLYQVILHAMQHHSELAQMLTLKGHSPGNIDFLFYRGI